MVKGEAERVNSAAILVEDGAVAAGVKFHDRIVGPELAT